jgi:FtsP/CotA-like multicopper oxidase with cupredoxin domain
VVVADVYGTGSGATATAVVANGTIMGIEITSSGVDYTAPMIVIEDATGKGAMAMAQLDASKLTGGIRKFVDSLPGVGAANASTLDNHYIPLAIPDTTTYPGSDYYEIELREYEHRFHSDLPPTRLRGYVQVKNGVDVTPISYFGPIIVAIKDRPVRVKFTNKLPVGAGGNLFLPADKTVMGAGTGPLAAMNMGRDDQTCEMSPGDCYTENRTAVHLHGNNSAWISDGTPHQWITPAGENTPYKKGVSLVNVPDMPDPGDGSMTFYYTNKQSARLLWYHDHAYGLTRLNVYAGEAAGYAILDDIEYDMIAGTNTTGINPENHKVLPDYGIPLVLQDKTFVDANTIAAQDPTWRWGTTPPMPHTGDLWFPHVYMPVQNAYDPSGINPFGRWHYALWFWPPATDHLIYPPIPNPYYDPINAPWEPPFMPDFPNPSMPGEAFMDTPLVNGVAYPYLEVEPRAYRFRILNAANDRYFNLQWYIGVGKNSGQGCTNTSDCPEVRMVPAVATDGFPAGWPADGRVGGVPDPATMGPDWIQIGTEGGFLPAPVRIPNQPVTWNMDPTTFNFGNVDLHSLLLAPAERVDVIVDFSRFAGKTLILYNDAPTPFPAHDPHLDYFTDSPDHTDIGGAPPTKAGYGPNTRTIMQIRVKDGPAAQPYDFQKLASVFEKKPGKRGVFEAGQDPIIIPQPFYNSAYDAKFPQKIVRQYEQSVSFTTLDHRNITIPVASKAIQDEMGETYDPLFGRMSSMLGLELPPSTVAKGFIVYPFISPPVDIIKGSVTGTPLGTTEDGTQIWRITHNGVDTHAIHLHLVNFQLINRVAWDGSLILPDENEVGWKETLRVNPLEHTIIAFKPTIPDVPFDIPNSIRPIDPTKPIGDMLMGPPGGFQNPAALPITILNHNVNFGWEYVWHCHMLDHEEMDMMHVLSLAAKPLKPALEAAIMGEAPGISVRLTWSKSLGADNYVLQKSNDPNMQHNVTSISLGNTTSYYDHVGVISNPIYYRVYATTLVGDKDTAGFPVMTVQSDYSDTFSTATRTWMPIGVVSSTQPAVVSAEGYIQMVIIDQYGQSILANSLDASGNFVGAWSQITATSSNLAPSMTYDSTNKKRYIGIVDNYGLKIGSIEQTIFGPILQWLPLSFGTSLTPAITYNPNGNKLYVAALSNNAIWLDILDMGANSSSGWQYLAINSLSSPALTYDSDLNKIYVAVRTLNNSISLGAVDGVSGEFVGWLSIGGMSSDSPAIAYNAKDKKLYIAIRDTNDEIALGSFNIANLTFEGWKPLGGIKTHKAPAMTWNAATGRLDLFIQDGSSRILHLSY